jgi:hypothetical protein
VPKQGGSTAAEVTWEAPQVVSGIGVASYQIVLDGYNDATNTTTVYDTDATEPGTELAHKFIAVPAGVFLQAHVKAVTTGTGTVSDDGASPRIAAYSPTPGPTRATHSKVTKGGNTTIRWKASKKVANAPVTGYRVTVEGNSKPTVVLVKVNKAHATAHKATLQLGSHGRAVKKLREALNVKQNGHSNYFGRSTRRAVIKYQKKHHKAQTGKSTTRCVSR